MSKQISGLDLAQKVADKFEQLPESKAIALGGSRVKANSDRISDIDIYVFLDKDIDLDKRYKIAVDFGTLKQDIGLTFWDSGDEWIDRETGIEVDIMYWHRSWIESKLDDLFKHHKAQLGYTTCFWYTILNLQILFDPTEWLEKFQKKYCQPYPRPLKEAIIAKNHPVLREIIPSYYEQIKKAVQRRDLISINHRISALLASYFDVLFALNELIHPGEKKILSFAMQHCKKLPNNFKKNIEDLFNEPEFGWDRLLSKLDHLLDNLDKLIDKEDLKVK